MAVGAEPLHWSRLYYDGVEHLLWNPEWIRSTQPDGSRKTIRMLMSRLEKLEAPLHHAIHLFSTLAPAGFVAKLFGLPLAPGSSAQVACCAEWARLPTSSGTTAPTSELCQPDVFLDAEGHQVAVEVKSRSKSSLEQVVKYAALMRLRARHGAGEQMRLVYLAPYETFADFWTRKAYADPEALKAAVQSFNSDKVERKCRRFGISIEEAKESALKMDISWRSVRDVRSEVLREVETLAAGAPSAGREVYEKLLVGFEKELHRWQA